MAVSVGATRFMIREERHIDTGALFHACVDCRGVRGSSQIVSCALGLYIKRVAAHQQKTIAFDMEQQVTPIRPPVELVHYIYERPTSVTSHIITVPRPKLWPFHVFDMKKTQNSTILLYIVSPRCGTVELMSLPPQVTILNRVHHAANSCRIEVALVEFEKLIEVYTQRADEENGKYRISSRLLVPH